MQHIALLHEGTKVAPPGQLIVHLALSAVGADHHPQVVVESVALDPEPLPHPPPQECRKDDVHQEAAAPAGAAVVQAEDEGTLVQPVRHHVQGYAGAARGDAR